MPPLPHHLTHRALAGLAGICALTGLASAAVVEASGAMSQQTTQQFQVIGKPLTRSSHDALRELPGRFALSDGRTLEVAHRGLRLMVAVGRRWALPVEHLGGHRFATRDGRLTVEFLPQPDGRVDALRLIEPRSVTLAGSLGRE